MKWSRFFHWCRGRNIGSWQTTVQKTAEFFMYLHRELELIVPAIDGYRSALDYVFTLTGTDLASK